MADVQLAPPQAPPLLTVLVPTRNRWALLAAQVKSVHLALQETSIAFDVLVHDNSTTSPPAGLVDAFPENVRYVRSPEDFDTAAENICEALQHCRGEYVWMLADDDGLELAGVRNLIEVLQRGEEDIIVFNSRHGRDERLAGSGAYVTQRARRFFYEKEMSCPISTFVEKTGFFYWLCAISTVVVRRSLAQAEPLRKYIGIARIYAHVAWLIEIGKDRRFLFVNRPLVVCGLLATDHDGGRHWRSVGVREGGYSNSVWTGLWLRALDELLSQQAMTLDQVRRTVDMNHHTRFHFGSNMAYQALEQLGEMPEPTPERDVSIISRWLLQLFPGAIFLTALINDIAAFTSAHGGSLLRIEQDSRFDQAVRALARDLRERAAWWRRSIGDTPWYTRFYVETLRLYDIYDMGSDWVAAHASFGSLREALEVIDLPSLPPAFLRAPSYKALRALIEAEPVELGALRTLRSASLQLPDEWARLTPESSTLRVDVAPAPVMSPAAADPELARLRGELVRQDARLAQIYASHSWRLTGWLRSLLRPPPAQSQEPAADLTLGARVLFCETGAEAYLVRGFSGPESWGRWTDGRVALFRCRHATCEEPGVLEVWPHMVWDAGGSRPCVVDVIVNGGRRTRVEVKAGEAFVIAVPARDMALAEFEVSFNVAKPKTTAEAPGGDTRALGVGIEALRLSPRSEPAAA